MIAMMHLSLLDTNYTEIPTIRYKFHIFIHIRDQTFEADLLYLSMYPGKRFSLPVFAASELISKYFPLSVPPPNGE